MKIGSKSILPVTSRHSRYGLDHKLAVPVSFVAGILIGIPITYFIVFLPILAQDRVFYSFPERHSNSVTESRLRHVGPSSLAHSEQIEETINGNVNDESTQKPIAVITGPVPPGILPKTRSDAASSLLALPTVSKPHIYRLTKESEAEKSGLKVLKTFAIDPERNPYSMPSNFVSLKKSYSIIPRHASDFYVDSPSARGREMSYTVSANASKLPNLEDIVKGVFWTPFSERLVPKGFDEGDIKLWRKFLNSTEVLKVEEGCGRMQNRLVTMAEGGKSCCRYRHNNDQIQGEIFSFYLGRLLGIQNLSPSSLALVDPRTRRWSSAASQVALAQWSSERPVVLTQFVEQLQPAFVPRHFRDKKHRRLHPIPEDLANMTSDEISELVQWSDLVVFDYLTANLDRVVNNMYNERWNPDMMQQPTHNLAKTPKGLLLFLDNESGLLHGYRLLEKYEHFHRALLDGLCIFRKNTVEAVDRLHRENNVEIALKRAFIESDPGMSDWLPFLPDRSVKTLKERIAQVHQHVKTCKSRFELASVFLQTPVTDR